MCPPKRRHWGGCVAPLVMQLTLIFITFILWYAFKKCNLKPFSFKEKSSSRLKKLRIFVNGLCFRKTVGFTLCLRKCVTMAVSKSQDKQFHPLLQHLNYVPSMNYGLCFELSLITSSAFVAENVRLFSKSVLFNRDCMK